jgi:hypothetical protein
MASGAFEITGTVLFQPLRPFDPGARVTDGTSRFAAEERFYFEYVPGSGVVIKR